MTSGVGSAEPPKSGGAGAAGAGAGTPFAAVPGLVETKEQHGETTLVVDPARLVEAATYLRDELGFNFLSDVTAVDYLAWGGRGVSGYIGTNDGRDINAPMTQGLQALPEPKPKRFAMNYHLLALRERPRRVRMTVFVDEGEPVESVVGVWPTADFHEREQYDMMGVNVVGHPNLKRILLDDDWAGHPLRKDYPVGGEPVRFSGER
ncbi:MAG TPA: NADH-quinone oxidoreductase subunit C [Gaiellaceae bacterium]|nr:NADH-quinone oxidoreductase subunit C [Gaiellaceae bacterium]